MKVIITDRRTLREVKPGQLIGYLRARGAVKILDYGRKGAVWEYGGMELLVPAESTLGDYGERIGQLIGQLSSIQNQSQITILSDIRNFNYDFIRIRNNSESVTQGSMNFGEAVEFVSFSRDMMLAAACSAATGKIYYPNKKPNSAEKYMKGLRFGQTQEGSYILTLLSPVARPLKEQGEPIELPTEEVYDERVVPTLYDGLNAMNKAAVETSEDDDIEHFIDKASSGLTVNLCEAITGMYRSFEPVSIEVAIEYSANRSIERRPVRIEVGAGNIDLIERVAAAIKERQGDAEESQTVRGPIIKLVSDDPQKGGEIIIKDFMAQKPRQIRILLDSQDYHQAIHAHDEGSFAEAIGPIARFGNGLRLTPDMSLKFFHAGE